LPARIPRLYGNVINKHGKEKGLKNGISKAVSRLYPQLPSNSGNTLPFPAGICRYLAIHEAQFCVFIRIKNPFFYWCGIKWISVTLKVDSSV
jgi:hypothetical protein